LRTWPERKHGPSRRGVALIMTLLVTALIAASALSFIRMSHLEARVADNTYALAQAEILAQAGLKAAMALLALDSNDYDANIDEELWTQFPRFAAAAGTQFQGGSFTGKIEDLAGRLDLNTLVGSTGQENEDKRAQMERLFVELGLDSSLVEALLDWLDPDEEQRPGGAESVYYGSLDKPYPCRNGSLYTLGQLTLVRGFTAKVVYERRDDEDEETPPLAELVTVYGDGLVNINTADRLVLMSLDPDLTDGLAREIIGHRESQPFDKLDRLLQVPGVTPTLFNRVLKHITVKSGFFQVRVEGRYNQAVVKVTAVVRRGDQGLTLIYYKSG